MYLEHPGFQLPESEDAKTWRYVDLAKFLSMLETRSLWFSRVDKMDDPYEGHLPSSQVDDLVAAVEFFARTNPELRERIGNARQRFEEEYPQRSRSSSYINCWHVSEHESGAMWQIYGNKEIAIQSTVRMMKAALDQPESMNINIGLVEYVDFEGRESLPFKGTTLHKRKMYDFERELRAVILDVDEMLPAETPGLMQPVNISKLVQSVYVGPGKPHWYFELIGAVLSRYGLVGVPLLRSALDSRPGRNN